VRTHFIHVEHDVSAGIDVKRGCELRVPGNFVVPIGRPGVHSLAECIIVCLDENEELGLKTFQVGCRLAIQRAAGIDGMDDGTG